MICFIWPLALLKVWKQVVVLCSLTTIEVLATQCTLYHKYRLTCIMNCKLKKITHIVLSTIRSVSDIYETAVALYLVDVKYECLLVKKNLHGTWLIMH